MLTIIPDIHADTKRLRASLELAGDDRIGFLGDLVDSSRDTKRANDRVVLQQVRALLTSGRADAVLGNHELDVILFHHRDADGRPFHPHNKANLKRHRSYIKAFGLDTPEARDWAGWLLTLPLWHQGEGYRLVHAQWSEPEIATIAERRPDGRLSVDDLPEIADGHTAFARAVRVVTSGRAAQKGEPSDRKGRFAWWRTLTKSPGDIAFFGHYKQDSRPKVTAARAMCLDYSYPPCIYRWVGETTAQKDHLRVIKL